MAQITAQSLGMAKAPPKDRRTALIRPGSAVRWAARWLPLGLLAAAGILVMAPESAWWVDPLAAVAGLAGAYLAGRQGYGAPGAEQLLVHELTKLEARERDLTRVLVGVALADVPPAGGSPVGGDGEAAPEPRPAPRQRGGGRPGVVRPFPGADDLERPLDDGEALE